MYTKCYKIYISITRQNCVFGSSNNQNRSSFAQFAGLFAFCFSFTYTAIIRVIVPSFHLHLSSIHSDPIRQANPV